MTPFECSNGYIKAGGFGQFCVKKEEDARRGYEIAQELLTATCPKGLIMCLEG